MKRLCPNCMHVLDKNEGMEGNSLFNKPLADWFCGYCFNDPDDQIYLFYESEVIYFG